MQTASDNPASGPSPAALFSRDHKVIAKQFLALGLAFLAVGGFMAMLIRWQMAHPAAPVPLVGRALFGATDQWHGRRRVGRALFGASGGIISPAAYTSLFTMHGTI